MDGRPGHSCMSFGLQADRLSQEVATSILVPCAFADETNALPTEFLQGTPLIQRDVVETALPFSLKVIVAVVAGEPKITLPLAKPKELRKHGHLLCSPGRDRMEALQALTHIVIQAVCELVLSLKCQRDSLF